MSESNAPDVRWRKSSFSGQNGCLEAAGLPGGLVAVRDSKNAAAGELVYNAHEWHSFLKGVRAGEFDDLAPAPTALA